MSDAIDLPPEVHALLAATPHHPGAVFVGGVRTTGVLLPDGDQMVEPLMILWIDRTSGMVRAQRLINPALRRTGGVIEAIDSLLDACLNPGTGLTPEPEAGRRRGARAGGTAPIFLPDKVVVTDEALASAVRDILGPHGVEVERAETLPELDRVFDTLLGLGHLLFDARPDEPFTWEIGLDLARQLFRAAGAYWREAPWEYMPDHPPLAVALGPHGAEPGREDVYASVLGAAGEVFGVAVYNSLGTFRRARQTGTELGLRDAEVDEALSMLRRMGVSRDEVPDDDLRAMIEVMLSRGASPPGRGPALPGTENTLAMWLTPAEETDPDYLDWIRQHGIKLFSRGAVPTVLKVDAQGQVVQPDERETRALAYALEALSRFFHRYHRLLDNPYYEPERRLSSEFAVGSKDAEGHKPATVRISFPPEGYEWSPQDRAEWFLNHGDDEATEEREQEPTEAGRNTLYLFKATLKGYPGVWRRIEIRGDQSLDELHAALQRAFNWDDDHLYAFFLSGKWWDPRTEYEDPRADEGRDASRYLVEHLPLKRGQRIAYVFDFGDEWRVTLRLEQIAPGAVSKRRKYARITEKEGRAPTQYHVWG